ncbi:MAG: spoIIIAH [Symbiobacteriaceae bacterium]|nr:spoIIIAH [Symbiobacteriaceae bacterium]
MIIVRRKAEVLRLGIFLVLMGLMAYFVMSKAGAFQDVAGRPTGEVGAKAGPGVIGSEVGTVGNHPATGASATPQDVADFPPADGREFFAEARLARDQGRSLQKQELQALIDNPNVDAEVRKTASNELQAVMKFAALETQAEALVRGRGVEEVLVTMSPSGAMVDVRTDDRSQQQAVQLADAVATVTGLRMTAVRVRFQE